MSKIPIKIKIALVDTLIRQENLFGVDYDETIIKFLADIWPLDEMNSEDSRFQTARGDAIQHLVNNDDWEFDYLLKERFSLINNDDELFIRFINTTVRPKYRESEDEIMKFVLLIKPHLEEVGYTLEIQSSDDSGSPIYKVIKLADSSDAPIDVEENKIPFFVTKEPRGRHNSYRSHPGPEEFPAFVLGKDFIDMYCI